MKYEFTVNITVGDKPYAGGDVIDAADVPDGSLESMVRLGQLVPHNPTLQAVPPPPDTAPAPSPRAGAATSPAPSAAAQKAGAADHGRSAAKK